MYIFHVLFVYDSLSVLHNKGAPNHFTKILLISRHLQLEFILSKLRRSIEPHFHVETLTVFDIVFNYSTVNLNVCAHWHETTVFGYVQESCVLKAELLCDQRVTLNDVVVIPVFGNEECVQSLHVLWSLHTERL